jgi:hypothetical protein
VSSPTGFFDVLYLGIFIILSPALDKRFYETRVPATITQEEVIHAKQHFHSVLNILAERFLIVLEGEPIAQSYVFNRMLGEFAAAVVVFVKAIAEDLHDDGDGPSTLNIRAGIQGLLEESYPTVIPYFCECLERHHKDFLWTGPDVQILRRSQSLDSILPLLSVGELLDLPNHPIYQSIPDAEKRHVRGNSSDLEVERPKKRRR